MGCFVEDRVIKNCPKAVFQQLENITNLTKRYKILVSNTLTLLGYCVLGSSSAVIKIRSGLEDETVSNFT
jgi:hypothetical protein